MQEHTIFKPLYTLTHAPIDVYFSKNSDDFVVREIPLYELSGDGEHLILHIQKKDLSTQEALRILSEVSGVKMREFGYAGLKDKQGLTTQYISMPRKFEESLNNFTHDKLKILSTNYHKNKLRIGHLKGNHFFIRLKKVLPNNAVRIEEALKNINRHGFANYFGYQRFGKFKDNARLGLEALNGKKLKNRKLNDFMISAFQSDLFNRWLSKRVEISRFADEFSVKELCKIYGFSSDVASLIRSQPHFFKILDGDVLGHYPFGKLFCCDDLETEIQRFKEKDISVCGLLLGDRAFSSQRLAKKLEDEIFCEFDEYAKFISGQRRFAWTYIEDLEYRYNQEKAHFSFSFSLQKGSYATTVLEEILHKRDF